MDTALYLSFLLVSFGVIIIPGPNVLVIVATSLEHGRIRGLQTVAGTTLAMGLQLFVVAAGTASFIHLLTEGLRILKWLGVVYLFTLGVRHLWQSIKRDDERSTMSGSGTFSRGFLVSIANPKTLLFFSALLPQFIDPAGDYLSQFGLLASTFLLLAALLDSGYALLGSGLRPIFERHQPVRLARGLNGLLYLGAGTWLATQRRG